MRVIMVEKILIVRKVGNSLGIFFPKGVSDVYDLSAGDVLAVDYKYPEIILRKKEKS